MILFTVHGSPVPKGSMKGFVINGRAVLTSTGGKKLKNWESLLKSEAVKALADPLGGAVGVDLLFHLKRPKLHYGTGRNAGILKERFSLLSHITKPDVDKLARAVLDGLTGVAFRDDAQVSVLQVRKVYANGDKLGVDIKIWDDFS